MPETPPSVIFFMSALEETGRFARKVQEDTLLSASFRKDAEELYDVVYNYLDAVQGIEFEAVRPVPLYRSTVQPVLKALLDDAHYVINVPVEVQRLASTAYQKPGIARWDRELASWRSTLKKGA